MAAFEVKRHCLFIPLYKDIITKAQPLYVYLISKIHQIYKEIRLYISLKVSI